MVARLLITGAMDAYSNMAMDEALFLEYTRRRSGPVIRFYAWDKPSLSIGCFQQAERAVDTAACERAGIPLVRRITGGGILLHGGEIPYSFVCSGEDVAAGLTVVESFKAVCAFILEFYRALGLAPQYAVDMPDFERAHKAGYVFCAGSRERYDIIINGRKIGGNAQKRRGDVLFQHGSIPLRRLALPPGLQGEPFASRTCLEDVLSAAPSEAEALSLLKASFERTFSAELVPYKRYDAAQTALVK